MENNVLVNGKEYEWANITVNIGGQSIECTPATIQSGINSVSYRKSGHKIERNISCRQFQKEFIKHQRKHGAKMKTIRIPRKSKKIVNYQIGLMEPGIKIKGLNPYKRIVLYHGLISKLSSNNKHQ